MRVPDPSLKAAVSVSEMAEMCSVSRSRWYELVAAGVFPPPVILPPMKRPVYDRTLIEKCLEIRQTGIGMSGAPVVFNRKSKNTKPAKSIAKQPVKEQPPDPLLEPILDAVKALGVTTTAQAVNEAVVALYPNGIADQDQGDVIRKTFLYLQRMRP